MTHDQKWFPPTISDRSWSEVKKSGFNEIGIYLDNR